MQGITFGIDGAKAGLEEGAKKTLWWVAATMIVFLAVTLYGCSSSESVVFPGSTVVSFDDYYDVESIIFPATNSTNFVCDDSARFTPTVEEVRIAEGILVADYPNQLRRFMELPKGELGSGTPQDTAAAFRRYAKDDLLHLRQFHRQYTGCRSSDGHKLIILHLILIDDSESKRAFRNWKCEILGGAGDWWYEHAQTLRIDISNGVIVD